MNCELINKIKLILDRVSEANCEILQLTIIDCKDIRTAPGPIKYITLLDSGQNDLIFRPWSKGQQECQIDHLVFFAKPRLYIVLKWKDQHNDLLDWDDKFINVSISRVAAGDNINIYINADPLW